MTSRWAGKGWWIVRAESVDIAVFCLVFPVAPFPTETYSNLQEGNL